MSTNLKEKRPRRPAARRSEIVIASMGERILIIQELASGIGDMEPHTARLLELLDELRRSLSKNADSGEGE